MSDLYPLQFVLGPGCEEDGKWHLKYVTSRGWNWKKLHADYGINNVIRMVEYGGWLDLCDDGACERKARAWRKSNLGY